MLIKGQNAENICYQDTMKADRFKDTKMRFVIENPPLSLLHDVCKHNYARIITGASEHYTVHECEWFSFLLFDLNRLIAFLCIRQILSPHN